MIRLSNSTQKLQALLGGAVTTNQLPVTVSWSDHTNTAYSGGVTAINTNSTTAVDICDAPLDVQAVRDIDTINVQNADTVAATITIRYNDNGTTYTLFKALLAVGDQLTYVHGSGWSVLNSEGSIKTGYPALTGAITTVGSVASLSSFTFAQLNTALSDADAARTDAANTFAGIQSFSDIVTGTLTSSSAVGGIGYVTGAGGAVTQLTSKATATPSINKMCGTVTMNNANLAADTSVTHTLTNTSIEANDQVICTHISGGTLGAYNLQAAAAAGSASVTLRNLTPGALAEAVVYRFTVIRGAVS